MSKEVNKFILEGEEIEFTDSKARQDISALDTKIDDEVGRLETEISGKATIDDSDITANKTWSSGQIFAEDNATREITATLNLTNRAEANYNVGDLIVYNSKLYKVIASINQGAALTPGTNIQLSKVSTELKGLENTCGNLQAQINNKATIDDSDITTSKTWSSSKILAEDNSIRENIATLNLTNLAEQNYDVGDLVEWNYKLCKVIAPISQGDLLELGTNLNRTTVEKELYQASGSEIDDLVISTQKTWSSSKINQGRVKSWGSFTFSYTTANVDKIITAQDILEGTFPSIITPYCIAFIGAHVQQMPTTEIFCGDSNGFRYKADITNTAIRVQWLTMYE